MAENRECSVMAWRSDGKVFDYTNHEFMLLTLEGADFPEVEIFTQNRGLGDGEIITGSRRKGRNIIVTARPKSIHGLRALRDEALKFHDPNYTFDVAINYMERILTAKNCKIKAFSFPTVNTYTTSKLTVSFLSEEPDLFSNEYAQQPFYQKKGAWSVTRAYAANKPMIYATGKKVNDILISYDGINAADMTLSVYFSGYVHNLTVGMAGKTVTFTKDFIADDILMINSKESFASMKRGTGPGSSVTMFPYTDTGNFDMRQLKIPPGETLISLRGDIGDAFDALVSYEGRYSGV